MKRVLLVAAGLALLVAATSPAISSAADNLALHEKSAILIRVMSRTCADCSQAPDMKTATWRFASDYALREGSSSAYAVLSYRSFDKTRFSWLLGYDPYRNGWRILSKSPDGRPSFRCGSSVLLNPHLWIDKQLNLIKRIATCRT